MIWCWNHPIRKVVSSAKVKDGKKDAHGSEFAVGRRTNRGCGVGRGHNHGCGKDFVNDEVGL